MPDNAIIHALPDEVANQIRAGEVVERPASVVKELMENAIDAGATQVDIVLKDAGRTLIQVIDNGKGMSATDAVTAFERHATSKIRQTEDLYQLHTMGFRGEALASIAAVSHVDMCTRREVDELGSRVLLSANRLELQECASCPEGTNLKVSDLFFNVPARRKFLKKNEVELRNILATFQQVSLVYPEVRFSLTHNDTRLFSLNPENRRQRILSLFGQKTSGQLIPIQADSLLANISGYVGDPALAQKTGGRQFFFVNGRYIQHPFFHKAVSSAYDKLLPAGLKPCYFIYFDVDPAEIDINIHPSKTEVKFANEQALFPMVVSIIKEALGRYHFMPSIDFDQTDAPDIPAYVNQGEEEVMPTMPQVRFDPNYNPFHHVSDSRQDTAQRVEHWERLYTPNRVEDNPPASAYRLDLPDIPSNTPGFCLWGKYWISPATEGIKVLHLRRAQMRVAYEDLRRTLRNSKVNSQQLLFPETLELDHTMILTAEELRPELEAAGFSFQLQDGRCEIYGTPGVIGRSNPCQVFLECLQTASELPVRLKDEIMDNLAHRLAHHAVLPAGRIPDKNEVASLLQRLQACQEAKYSPDGKLICVIVSEQELHKLVD